MRFRVLPLTTKEPPETRVLSPVALMTKVGALESAKVMLTADALTVPPWSFPMFGNTISPALDTSELPFGAAAHKTKSCK